MSRANRTVTISDIAERAGVSISAVSFALNGRKGVSEKTRARILQVANEMGWAPTSAARSLAGTRNESIGLVLARDPRLVGVEPFYMQLLAGIESELAKVSYALLLQVAASAEDELTTLRKWQYAHRVDGLILVDVALDDPRVELASQPRALPCVVVGDPGVAGGQTAIWTADAEATRTAVRHLTGLGHRRIARVAGPPRLAHTGIRDATFQSECQTASAEAITLHTDYSPENGASAVEELLRRPERPTAIIFDNDVMAMAGLAVALGHRLRVPEDLSIVASGDSIVCEHTFPRLTALSYDVVAFGAKTARLLLDRIDGAEPQAVCGATPALALRDSTAPPA